MRRILHDFVKIVFVWDIRTEYIKNVEDLKKLKV